MGFQQRYIVMLKMLNCFAGARFHHKKLLFLGVIIIFVLSIFYAILIGGHINGLPLRYTGTVVNFLNSQAWQSQNLEWQDLNIWFSGKMNIDYVFLQLSKLGFNFSSLKFIGDNKIEVLFETKDIACLKVAGFLRYIIVLTISSDFICSAKGKVITISL